jgi:hypothetical protein
MIEKDTLQFRNILVYRDEIVGKVAVDRGAIAVVVYGVLEHAHAYSHLDGTENLISRSLALMIPPASMTATQRVTRNRAMAGSKATSRKWGRSSASNNPTSALEPLIHCLPGPRDGAELEVSQIAPLAGDALFAWT